MKKIFCVLIFFSVLIFLIDYALASDTSEKATPGGKEEGTLEEEVGQIETIHDPLESYNRAFFNFNDKLYFKVLKPVARGYGAILPKKVRLSIQNFFWNVEAPIRMLNCGLQCNTKGALVELSRFGINTTLGFAGFFDPAKSWLKLEMQDEDFGQTLGCHKGPGFYFNVPFVGPESLRDGIGGLVDLCIVPSIYVLIHYSLIATTAPQILKVINRTSLNIGEYEEIKRAAIDPYIAIRDAYYQNREDLIKR